MELDVKLDSEKIKKWSEEKKAEISKRFSSGMHLALIHLEGMVAENLSTGKFGVKTRKGNLMDSFHSSVSGSGFDSVGTFGTNLRYAAAQEYGAEFDVHVTDRMASFFWARWYATGDLMYKFSALKRGGTVHIKIPAHGYLKGTFEAEKGKMLSIIDRAMG